METNYKITIPKPCHEDWDKMTPDQTGRFCSSCVKSVVDFTHMKTPEIQEYFIQNQGQKVCGRFKTDQLDAIIIQIPRNVLFSQVHFHKMFLLALLISMPGLLSGQNTNGTKQKIETVKIVDSINDEISLGRTKLDKAIPDNTVMTPERKARVEELKRKRDMLMKQREAQKNKDRGMFIAGVVAVDVPEPKRVMPAENEILNAASVDVKPEFPGGLVKFYQYVNSNVKIPQEHKNGTARLFFTFVINTDGSLSDIKLLRGINKEIDIEVLRVLESSPKWIPGEYMGKKVRVNYSIPIKITAKE